MNKPATFFEKIRLDNSNDFKQSKGSERATDHVLIKQSFDSSVNTVDFYQQELQKLQRVDKMLKKESKKQKKGGGDHGFFSPQKRRKDKTESPRFTPTLTSNVGGLSSTTGNNFMQSTMSSKTNNDDLQIVNFEQE